MHPSTELRWVNKEVGFGVYASHFIPKGTIVYVSDPLEIVVKPKSHLLQNDAIMPVISKYSYIDQKGRRILSWDHAKYVNHSCEPNSLSTGYGFEIAIRDIEAGEEITDEYGLLNIEQNLNCLCGSSRCRKTIENTASKEQIHNWDRSAKEALDNFSKVDQPLASLLAQNLKEKIDNYLLHKKGYKSVKTLFLKMPVLG